MHSAKHAPLFRIIARPLMRVKPPVRVTKSLRCAHKTAADRPERKSTKHYKTQRYWRGGIV
jgi:hypothetical protein